MADFTNYDYQQQLERMRELLKNKEGWGDAYESSMGDSLIRMMVDATDYLHYMLERRTMENYITTAKTRTAIISRAGELGYRARRAISNTGVISFSLVDDNGNEVTSLFDTIIPKYTNVVYDGKNFVTTEDCTIEAGSSSTQVRVKSGNIVRNVFDNSELDNNNYIIVGGDDYELIDEDSLSVMSAGEIYYDVRTGVDGAPERRAMSFLSPDDKFYDIRYAVDGMRLIMGDDFFGKKPEGDIEVSYIKIDDVDNVLNTVGNVFEDITATDTNGDQYTISVKNVSKINSGREPETTQSIKQNAQTYHKTNGRAVTPDDLSYWVKNSRIGGLVDATAIGEHELDSLVHNSNNIYVSYLKQDSQDLTVEEEQNLRNYLKHIIVGSMYPIFRNADKLSIGVDLDVRKNKNAEISNKEVYKILKQYFDELFSLDDNSIGREIQHSEIVRDLQELTYEKDNIVYKMLDYLKLTLNGYYPFDVPVRVSNATININSTYTPTTGDSFVLNLSNIPCEITVDGSDDLVDILNKMRDKIMDITPYIASVQFGDIAVDGFGFPLPIKIEGEFGEGVLIGTDTPYTSPNDMIQPPAVGSAIAKVSLRSPAIDVQHFYYSTPAGRRPLIPLRNGTTVSFVAPSDTDVDVYVRTVLQDESTESLLINVPAGGSFSETFTSGEHGLQVEYANDSGDDVIVDIVYPEISDFSAGLKITTKDGFGRFTLNEKTGDLSDFVISEFKVTVPQISREIKTNEFNILPASLEILDSNGQTVFTSKSDGRLVNTSGAISETGRVDYFTGTLTIPKSLSDGSYYIKYRQNSFQNFKTDDTSAIVLSDISDQEQLPELFSKITTE